MQGLQGELHVHGMNARIDEQFHVQVINAPMEALRLKYKVKSKGSLIFRHPGERPSQNLRDEMDLKPNTIFIRDRETKHYFYKR